MTSHTVQKGDTGSPLTFFVGDASGPWDLEGATVVFRYFVNGSAVEKSMTADADQDTNRGKASAYWESNELNSLTAGSYRCQAKVTFSNGRVQFAPTNGFNTLIVRDSV